MTSWIKRLFGKKDYLTRDQGELIFSMTVALARKVEIEPEELSDILSETFLNEMYVMQLVRLLEEEAKKK